MRGRVMALSAMVLPVGGAIVGWIGDLAGPRAAIALGSATALAACALAMHRLGASRRLSSHTRRSPNSPRFNKSETVRRGSSDARSNVKTANCIETGEFRRQVGVDGLLQDAVLGGIPSLGFLLIR
jgi:hypothetical protein